MANCVVKQYIEATDFFTYDVHILQ